MGIKMGTPFYQVKDKLESGGVAVFSSNYTLYGDMSRRVMMLLSSYSPKCWQYSIDEMFLDLSGMGTPEYIHSYAKDMRHVITKGTGIPVTIGLAPTKTLAKMASKYGKKYPGYQHVCMIDTEEKREKALAQFPIEDVWGIGRKNAVLLNRYGVDTALDFVHKSEAWVRAKLHIQGVRTWKELQGIDCISIDDLPHKQSICTSRSFADQGLSQQSDIEEAVANFTSACASKLARQHTVCQSITVFAHTSRFRFDLPQKYIYASANLPVPTNDQQELISYAMQLLRRQWDANTTYMFKKAGVIVWNISRDSAIQASLFDSIDREKQARLAAAINEINRKNGYGTIKVAVQGTGKRWHLKCEQKSKCYTTNINEILEVK